jgi:glycerol-1-phosphate dehydrogenase [NAD(P)+]
VLPALDPERVAGPAAAGMAVDVAARGPRVAAAFDRLDASGAATAECWADYQRKLERWNDHPERRSALARDWPIHRAAIAELVLAPDQIVAGLRAAGAPTRFSELEPAIPPDVARWAIASCHLMRDRFTVADLVDLTEAAGNRWDETFADDLLSEAAELGAGL